MERSPAVADKGSKTNTMIIGDDDVFLQTVINELSTLSYENDAEMSEHISFVAACRHDDIDMSGVRNTESSRRKGRSSYSDLRALSKYSLNRTMSSLDEEQRRKERIAEYLSQVSEHNRTRTKTKKIVDESSAAKTSVRKSLLSTFLPPILFREKKPVDNEG